MLATVLTSLLLLAVADPSSAAGSASAQADTAEVDAAARDAAASTASESTATAQADQSNEVARATGEEAQRALEGIWDLAERNLPRFLLVLALLVLAWLTVRAVRFGVRRALGNWPRSSAVIAVCGVAIWLLAIGLSITIIAGDVRAFLGSVGLLGLAASWALQTPIESFTGWLLNAFKGYYQVGDRVEVGDVFGDVHRIDVLTTTVWEIGSPFRSAFVRAEQPTGRLITFPNNQVLTGSVVNFTRDFSYVWDEITVGVANESDMRYALEVVERTASEVLEDTMRAPAEQYESLLRHAKLEESISTTPEVFISLEESYTNVHVRYLVHARQRRKHKSRLLLRLSEELKQPQHKTRIIGAVPRQQVQLVDKNGLPRDPDGFDP